MGWEKVACWSTKAAIYLKRVKVRYHRRPPTTTPFPRLGVRNPNPKLQSALSQERVMLRTANLADTFRRSILLNFLNTLYYLRNSTNFIFCRHIHRIDQNKSALKISGKLAVGVLRDCPNLLRHPYYGASLGNLCDSAVLLLVIFAVICPLKHDIIHC